MSNRSCLVASHDAIWSAECGLLSKKIAAKIRGDWLIENQVHWVKDVIFNEDIVILSKNERLFCTIITNNFQIKMYW